MCIRGRWKRQAYAGKYVQVGHAVLACLEWMSFSDWEYGRWLRLRRANSSGMMAVARALVRASGSFKTLVHVSQQRWFERHQKTTDQSGDWGLHVYNIKQHLEDNCVDMDCTCQSLTTTPDNERRMCVCASLPYRPTITPRFKSCKYR